MRKLSIVLLFLATSAFAAPPAFAPDRKAGEGDEQKKEDSAPQYAASGYRHARL